MKNEIRELTVIYVLAFTLLFAPSGFDGIMTTVVYSLAFILPIFLGILLLRRKPSEDEDRCLIIKKEELFITLPVVFPCILFTLSLSSLSSLFMNLAGFSRVEAVDDNLLVAILLSAVLPAILEEVAFRYLPMRFIGKRAPRLSVILSALMFALVHHSFFSYLYAFGAGVVFMLIDLMCDSVIPSVIIHFCNNLLAIFWIKYSSVPGFSVALILALVGLSLISVAAIFVMRKSYIPRLRGALAAGEKFALTADPVFLIIPSLIVAVAELL